MKRVVITGLGIVSSIGNNQKEVLASLKEGRSGITFSEKFKEIGMRSHVWGNVKLDTTGLIDRKIQRFMSDASVYAYLAMDEAIKDSGLTDDQVSNIRSGLVVGSGGGSPYNQVASADGMRARGLRGVGPYMVTRAMASGVSACLATPFKIKGVNYSISSACSTSAHCIGHAAELIQLGKQDIVFAGGGEELCWEMSCEFDAMGALSTKYNETPEKSSRTYDKNRDGFVIAGGGGIVVVEELEHALARGAHIYAEIVGYGATSDGADMVVPSGEGAVRCMNMALQGVKGSIDYVNTHGTSTPAGDLKELEAIREVFGDTTPAISATKAMTGHSLGAAGVHEAIYSLLMLEHDFIAPSINIEDLDDKAAGMNIITKPTEQKLNTVMSNSFGFGGTNASLVMSKYLG
ncbi:MULTISPECIES: beta-ketoacyl-ACP synthase I [Photorhabdus]|uniref:beta-ketoacyl-ACP synthase I n=1 Tax=Photorhabdus TaxID=29487 RepID=UPI00052C4031|nr:beta-ketoacyl-ACP synthase I [Photorhabdus aegyptia]KGM26411.1 3-oxoacyl-ACP synthase [Photorhabdus luminescens]MCC8458195.1 beta-ketoacyl-ACP synthase I [Photorhabdus aegyptia]PQQ26988.1 beta-ketoacyl-[acyl-carrier-protein] synthase I [Photorhabdus luminescens]PQQ28436.1 beta-ketoacyl-[acyl-carrier-protein] synthase I [Photorhabdus luminescens]PQQ40940.1 beta-ketoacyl-[acyl-carrier-protein] synthase I [Photorhabdus luminescens]